MRYRTVFVLLAVLAGVAASAGRAHAQAFLATDWIQHRGNRSSVSPAPLTDISKGREGRNAGDLPENVQPVIKGRVWIWPPPADMPAEMVSDDSWPVPPAMFPAGGSWSAGATPRDVHNFGTAAAGTNSWRPAPGPSLVPAGSISDRGVGAWPPIDVNPAAPTVVDQERVGDYFWADAEQNAQLATLANLDLRPGVPGNEGLDRLRMLPNMDSFAPEPALGGRNFYSVVHQELVNNQTFARWSFGRRYPQGTAQGTLDVSGNALQPNQRYAIYIRYPSSSTVIGGVPRPNSDWVFVRVSWGNDPNDARLSRIFLVNMGDTGGFWKRIQSSAKEDRYFPYDGLHPITVTLYTATFTAVNEVGINTIIPADAVRLVPEAHRGDINGPATSAVFPAGADPRTNPNAVKLTYFGRDETMGPRPLFEPANIANTTPVGGFLGIPFDPTRPPQEDATIPATYNPTIADASSSIRSAVFYCFEDYVFGPINNHRYGKLRWRFVSRTTPVRSHTIDDEPPAPLPTPNGFNQVGFTPVQDVGGAAQAYGGDPAVPVDAFYHTAPAVVPQAVPPAPTTWTAAATWTAALTSRVPGGTYSVWVWIPANVANNFAHRAHYQIQTDAGPMDVQLDQRNTDPLAPNPTNVGQWRRLATGIRFPGTVVNGVETVTALVTLGNDSAFDAAAGRFVVADAIQFVAESQSRNSIVSSPLLARVAWPSGTVRNVVYFGTTDGHLWCLDALGPDQAAGGPAMAGGFPRHTGTLTSAYWVYPSISNPQAIDPMTNPQGDIQNPRQDPNLVADPFSNRAGQGIDGDVEDVNIGGNMVPTVNEASRVPDLGAFVSSPLLVEIPASGNITQPMIVVGNNNGRIYGFSPTGRVDAATGEPFAATFATHLNPAGAPAESAGVPGTTRRVLTWPTLKRDKWLRANAPGFPNDIENGIRPFTDDPAKVAFTASLAAELNPTPINGVLPTSWVVAGAGDGHVYGVQLQGVQFNERISNSNAGAPNDGAPRWQFPNERSQLGPITQTGTLTFNGQANAQYVFTAPDTNQTGFRVYGITIPAGNTNQTAAMNWAFPHTTSPGGNPTNSDVPPVDSPFTAPIWLPTVRPALNAGNEVVFIGNTNGRVYAIDASQRGNPGPPGALRPIEWPLVAEWTDFDPIAPLLPRLRSPSRRLGPTHASATYHNNLATLLRFQTQVNGRGGPAIILPLDNGNLVAFNALTGGFMWVMPDGEIGGVPVNFPDFLPGPPDGLPDPLPIVTSTVWRGADAITADQWIYQGDQGNQDLGESNGQMRAYANSQLFGINTTPNAPAPDITGIGNADIRIVDVFNGINDTPPGPWHNFAPAQDPSGAPLPVISPYHARLNGLGGGRKGNTSANVLVYEWGDDIRVAAWGAYYFEPGNPNRSRPPSIMFFVEVKGQNQQFGPIQAVDDTAYPQPGDPPLQIDTLNGDPPGVQVRAWVAKFAIPIGRGSTVNLQTPGRDFTIRAAIVSRVDELRAGQVDLQPFDWQPPGDPSGFVTHTPSDLPPPRLMAFAHPLAVTTRGFLPGGLNMLGPSLFNVIGWSNGFAPDNLGGDLSEIIGNGNVRWDINTWQVDMTNPTKDVYAPLGLINHGATGTYTAIEDRANPNFGRRVQGLFVADRSNMYKRNQPLQIRVERSDYKWGWNPNNPNQQYTGNVMNPLPWETFPNTVPNVSPDYPNLDGARGTFRGNGIDMSIRTVSLPFPDRVGTPIRKQFSPLAVDLQVSVPQFQPANVNTDIFSMRNQMNPSYMSTHGFLGPLALNSGRDVANNPALVGNIAPSAGYVSQYYVFVDTNQNNRLESASTPGATQQVLTTGQEEAYRQMTVGAAVPPDLRMRVEEETIDLGKQPHGLGFHPLLPFAPSGVGPYPTLPAGGSQSLSPWNAPGLPQFFMPFTVRNQGNVNLVNVRAAKVIGQDDTAVSQPPFWARLNSDQVEPATGVGQIWGVPFYAGAQNDGRGSIGVVTSLDHSRTGVNPWLIETDHSTRWTRPNFWPMDPVMGGPAPFSGNPYVPALPFGHPLATPAQGWTPGRQPRPTLHKARVGDPAGTTMSIPDVAHGDPLGILSQLANGNAGAGIRGREIRPMVGLAIPLGTPAGTYGAPVNVFEDAIPDQWWSPTIGLPLPGSSIGWVNRYEQITGQPSTLRFSRDDDGLLNVLASGQPIESVANPTFRLKATVREARLTNGPSVPITAPATYLQTTGDYPQIDVRINADQFGANIQPTAIMDANTRSINLFYASNRLNNFAPLPPLTTSDVPWYLNFTQLAQGPLSGTGLDWLFEPVTGNRVSWWQRLPVDTQYPAPPWVGNARNIFPSDAGDLPPGVNLPLVPGQISPNTERHATPALAQDSIDPTRPVWIFWQGAVYKTAGGPVPAGANQNFSLDTRTFWTQLVNGQPAANTTPLSFLNDPNLPKFAPKPLVLSTATNVFRAYLFWYGGPRGRTRLYFNRTNNLTTATGWTRDEVLDTPGALQWMADPVPFHRRLIRPNGTVIDTVDLVYTGTLNYRQQAETMMTRYRIENDGDLEVEPLPRVNGEMLVREGTSQTWVSRDLSWVYRDQNGNLVDNQGRAPYTLFLLRGNNAPVVLTTGTPVFDRATGFVHWTSALGGNVMVDPQGGRVIFTGVAPQRNDRLMAHYTPRTLRLNATRNEPASIAWSDHVDGPVFTYPPQLTLQPAWANDAGFAPRPHVNAPGSNTGPESFIDRMENPKSSAAYLAGTEPLVMLPGIAQNPATISRMWTFYRKANSNVTSPATIYFKTMRLMVRLPRGVQLSNPGARRSAVPNVTIGGNRGPVEIDWARGRLYFTEVDEGNTVEVSFRSPGINGVIGPFQYRVAWGDEISTAVAPGDQVTNETVLPTDSAVNEGQISAFKDLFADKVWVFWSSTRAGTTDLYYMPISPQFYPLVAPTP